jgi:hypothetical protein
MKTTEKTKTRVRTEKSVREKITRMTEIGATTETLKTTAASTASPTVHFDLLKTTAASTASPTVHFDLEQNNDHRPTVIVLVITSFIIGISFGLCCVWFVILRQSKRKNKVCPSSSQYDTKVNILQPERNELEDITKCDKSKSFRKKARTNQPRKSFQVVSNVRLELNEVEI